MKRLKHRRVLLLTACTAVILVQVVLGSDFRTTTLRSTNLNGIHHDGWLMLVQASEQTVTAYWKSGDEYGYSFAVYNISGKYLWGSGDNFKTGALSSSRDGSLFLLGKAENSESPIEYEVRDRAGVVLSSKSSTNLCRISDLGGYVYRYNRLQKLGRPEIYDNSFKPLRIFDSSEVSRSWDAHIAGDSLYILRDYHKVSVYTLPEVQLVKSVTVSMGEGKILHRFCCNSGGSLCLISNSEQLGVVNTSLGTSQTIDYEKAHNMYITDDGSAFFAFRPSNRGLMHIDDFRVQGDGFALSRSYDVDLTKMWSIATGFFIDEITFGDSSLCVNFRIQGPAEGTHRLCSALIDVSGKGSTGDQAVLLNGYTWPCRTFISNFVNVSKPFGEAAILTECRIEREAQR